METQIPAWFEIGSAVVLVLILAVDVFLAFRRPHIPSNRESAIWISAYVLLALIFAAALFLIGDAEQAGQFVAGWLTEYSLSVDNLFVFLLIMARFAVPRRNQQEILMVGIVLALIFRGRPDAGLDPVRHRRDAAERLVCAGVVEGSRVQPGVVLVTVEEQRHQFVQGAGRVAHIARQERGQDLPLVVTAGDGHLE